MDVETERVERTMTRSPKDKILVDSGDDEENTNAPLNYGNQPTELSDEINDKSANPVADVSLGSLEQKVLEVEQVELSESISSERLVPAKSEPPSKGDELFSADVTQARYKTSALSSEPPSVPHASNGEDRVSTSDVPVHETVSVSESPKASESTRKEKETPAYALSENAPSEIPEFCTTRERLNDVDEENSAEVLPTHETNSEVSSNADDRLLLTGKASSQSVEHEQFENEPRVTGLNASSDNDHHECAIQNVTNGSDLGGHVNGVCPSDVQEDVTQGSSNIGISASKVAHACKEVHSSAQDSLQPTLDKLDDVKEPEEPDHASKCQLLHDDEETTEPSFNEETTEPLFNEETTEVSLGEDVNAAVGKEEDEDGWIYVLGHDKLKKRVITKGVENSRPVRGQVVTVNCVGHLEDGTEVDKHDNWSLALGEDEFIHAFDLCVAIMDKGETCEIVTDSRFTYGELGREPDIPSNATISYIIELIECHDQRGYSALSVAERIQLSNDKRERGNYLYSRNEYSRSIDSYTRALKALDEDFESHGESPEELQAIIDTRIKCHNNMAAAQMKVGAWDVAAKSCDVVLKVQPDNVKALFRKGKCLANKGDVSAAIPLLKRALKLEPETKIIHQELSRLERKNKVQTETEKALYQKMLGTDKEPPPAKKKKESTSKWLWYMAGGAAAVMVSLGLTAYRYIHV